MKQSRFAEVFGGEGHVPFPESPEIGFLKALAAQDEEKAVSFFEEEKQFGGISAVDTAHGRYEGLEGIRECVRTFNSFFHAETSEVEVVNQIPGGCRRALEYVFHFYVGGEETAVIPMGLAADLRDGLTKLDEVRMYVNCRWIDDYPKYRHPLFPERDKATLRTEMLSGVMPVYMNLVMNEGMAHIPDLMTDNEPVIFGAYEPEKPIEFTTRKEYYEKNAEKMKNPKDSANFGLKYFVLLRMETIMDDGRICAVEWEQVVTKRGREERHRLSEAGMSFYERAKDGKLKSFRIIDYAGTEGLIDWEKCPVSREEAEAFNYLGYDVI